MSGLPQYKSNKLPSRWTGVNFVFYFGTTFFTSVCVTEPQ